MKIETKYNVGDEVILSGVVCATISAIYVHERFEEVPGERGKCRGTGEIITTYKGRSDCAGFSEDDIICLKSEFLAHFTKTPEGAK